MPLNRIGRGTESRLLHMPESGMGYQVINYRDAFLVVFQTTLAIPLRELRERRFTQEDYQFLSGDPEAEAMAELEPLELFDDFSLAFSVFEREYTDPNAATGLASSETMISPPDYVISHNWPYSYYRYCAYYKDKRVAADGSFLSGSYATTYNDMHFVPSGFAAVGRYALPNPASALFLFPILTYDRPTLMGTVTPNFGQAGGGVEVLFQNGAQNSPGVSFMVNAG